jgi:WD40-like Beta Propeller Repeat
MARRRTLYLPLMIAAAVAVACAAPLLAISQKADAAFPGKNGRIAYSAFDFDGGPDETIYTIKAGGGAKTKVTRGYQPSFSPDGKRIAYTVLGENSARDALSETHQGFQPSAGLGPAYNASEKLQLTKTASGARVTLNWVYAEENYVSIGYQVEDLKDDRRVAGHPAELQPLLGFGYGKPTPREEKYLKKSGLGTDIVALTDERATKFRMVDNVGETAYGSARAAKGPLENLVAFKPKEGLKPSEEHDFRLQVPLYESAVVPLQGKQPPPEPFPGEPFVFKFDVPVHAVHVVDVNQKATAKGLTLRLDRVINSLGRPRAVICYQPPDDKHYWFMYGGGEGVFQDGWSTSGWSGSGSMRGVPPGKCQKLMLEAPADGRTSVEVKRLEGEPDCPYNNAEDFEACYEKIGYRTIRGPWKFGFKVPNPAGGARPEREADD